MKASYKFTLQVIFFWAERESYIFKRTCLVNSYGRTIILLVSFFQIYRSAYQVNVEVMILPWYCMPFNPQCYASGIARGIGWQHIGAYIKLGAYYLVWSPVGAVLPFFVCLKSIGLNLESLLYKHFCLPMEQVSQISSFLYNCPPLLPSLIFTEGYLCSACS